MKITEIEKYIKIVENFEIKQDETWIEGFEKDFLFKINSLPPEKYKNIHINEDINFQNENFEDFIVFNNIVFNKDFLILFSVFKDYVSFNNCAFEGNLTFGSCVFEKEVRFINCKFNFSIDFWRTSFKSIVVFSESHFKGEESVFRDSLFNDNVFFEKAQIVSKINFQNTIFEANVYFEGAVLENIDFSGAKFVDLEKDTYIKENQRKEINFSRVKFGTVSFENTLFEKNVRFHESTFEKKANFYNTSFKKLADFYLVNFEAEQQFHLTDFLDRAIFSNVIFHKEVQFIYNKTEGNSYINFESAIFKRGLDISRSNFNCNLNFWNVTIEKKGVEEIFDYLSNKATFKELKYIDDFGEHKERTIPSVYKQIRESFCIIKNSFYAQNNRIEGLKFYEKEMSVYLEEKRAQDNLSKAESKTINEIVEKSSKKGIDIRNKYKKIKFLHNLGFFVELFLFLIVNFLFSIVCVLLSPLLLILCAIVNILDLKIFDNIYINIKNFINFTFCELHKIKEWNSILFHFFFISLLVCLLISYIIYQEYALYWISLFVFLLYFFVYFYKIRTKIKENIRNNDYMSLVLLLIPIICFFILLYGQNNYQENDFVYRKIEYLFFFFRLTEEKKLFILELILIPIAITLAFLPRKQDRILLWLNKNSNSFGTDWVVGINFTMLVALVATIIVLLLSPNMCFLPKWEGIGNFMRALVEMFNITEWKDIEILGERPSNWQYIFIFLARIFIAYGMYQTIQAFRKFGKS